MKILAESIDGYLISATKNEVEEILASVLGKAPEKIGIGQQIPAIDYAGTIKKVKGLKDDYSFQQIFKALASVIDSTGEFKKAVEEAGNLNYE